MSVPKYDEMYNVLLKGMRDLGGSATNAEIEESVANELRLTDDDLNKIHRGNRTQFSYRLAWTRNYLKRYGMLANSARGVWSLTEKGKKSNEINKNELNRFVKSLDSQESNNSKVQDREAVEADEFWQDQVVDTLLQLAPSDFERFCQRLLRESGFVEVQVTGKAGDGGIDGRGIIRIGGLLSFYVIFQCKRYKGNVGSKEIRDFRGAMIGRADKGLFITTGRFTRDAREEAIRDGAPPIDLIDGTTLAEKMKELELGVSVVKEEIVEVDRKWFSEF